VTGAELASRDLRTVGFEALLATLDRRARPGERPEELMIDLGLVGERELALELALRGRREYTGLRGIRPDPNLFMYLPLQLALVQRCCPLTLEDGVLRVASAWLDPDLSSVQERFPQLQIELLVAPRSEVLAAVRAVAETL